MRPVIVAALGFSLAGCLVVGDPGPAGPAGPAGDDDQGPGTGADPGPEPGPGPDPVTPKLDVTVDKPTISTELYSTNIVTVSLQGSGGLTGSVALTASVVDGNGAALPRWTVALDKPSVDLAADGTATVVATVKVEATSAAGTINSGASSAVNVTRQLTVNLTVDANGDCVYPAAMVGTVKVANGTKIRWVNGSTANLTIHITDPEIDGLTHQQGATPPAGVYERTVAGTTGTTDWYCHDLNNPKNLLLQAVP
jgi:hypothetical protein